MNIVITPSTTSGIAILYIKATSLEKNKPTNA